MWPLLPFQLRFLTAVIAYRRVVQVSDCFFIFSHKAVLCFSLVFIFCVRVASFVFHRAEVCFFFFFYLVSSSHELSHA